MNSIPKERVLVSWSGGKDSALALYDIRDRYEVAALLTTVTEGYDRISMHGVRRDLLERQAAALGHPLEPVMIPQACTNLDYERRMRDVLTKYVNLGVRSCVFGDIYLEDVRKYREEKLLTVGMKGVFPLWGQPPADLARRFIGLGFKAVLCCVDTKQIDGRFAGRDYDDSLLAELPPQADCCGENGEFHSFVYDGPLFRSPIAHQRGERVLRDNRFAYCDLISVGS